MFSGLAVSHDAPARRWTALASFTLQAAAVAALVAYPMLHPDSLRPMFHPVSVPVLGSYTPSQPQRGFSHSENSVGIRPIVVSAHPLTFGPAIHPTPAIDVAVPDISNFCCGSPEGIEHSIVGDYLAPLPTIRHEDRPPRISAMMQGNLIHRVEPQYPLKAKQLRIEGTVILKAFISREGAIERVQVVRGHPLLIQAALDAVRQWRYRPYYLNNEPIEVETEITVNFVMQH